MKFKQFWNTVPKPARNVALITIVIAVLAGLAAGFSAGFNTQRVPAPLASFGAGAAGLFMGTLFAIFILCLGYVYADARRRAMPPVLWTLIALLVPNLLGFLFYFALRKPLAAPCVKCGNAVAAEQRFCAWCGCERTSPPSSQTLSQVPGVPS